MNLAQNTLRSLIAKDAEISDIFMRAFILRRLALVTEGLGNVIILGFALLSLSTLCDCASFSLATDIRTHLSTLTVTRPLKSFSIVLT